MDYITIDGKRYYPTTAKVGDKRFILVGPDLAVYRFETAERRLDFIGVIRAQLESARADVVWDAPDVPADTAASKRAGAIVAQINRGGEVGKSLHGALFGEILSKESDNA